MTTDGELPVDSDMANAIRIARGLEGECAADYETSSLDDINPDPAVVSQQQLDEFFSSNF